MLFFTACKKDKFTDPTPATPTTIEDMQVTSGFDWKTTRDIQLTLTGKISNIVEVSTIEGVSYQTAFLSANLPYTMKFSIPAYEKSIRLNYSGEEINLELDNGILSYQFQ